MTLNDVLASVLGAISRASEKPNPLLQQMQATKSHSVEVEDGGDGCGKVRESAYLVGDRSAETENKTLVDVVGESCRKFAESNAVAYRPWIKETTKPMRQPSGKTIDWKIIHLGETQYLTYDNFWEHIQRVGSALENLNLAGQNRRIGIYADTRWEWICSLYGMWTRSIVGVTVYSTLDKEALTHALQEAEVSAIFVSADKIQKVLEIAPASLEYIFCYDPIPTDNTFQLPDGVKLIAFEQLLEETVKETEAAPSPDDIAMVMYTSGTTGLPKGVVMTHGNLANAVAALLERLKAPLGIDKQPGESYVAFLPLAHIMELTVENVMFSRGAMVGYGNVRTLTDLSAVPHGDLKEYTPSMFIGVPKIFDAIKKSIEGKLPAKGTLRRVLFERAYADKRKALCKGRDTPFWNSKVFDKISGILGGKVRMIVCGGAPLNAATHEFLTVVFGVSVAQGYGLTETVAMGTIQHFWDISKENVGGILEGVEVKLRDLDDWRSTQGEILMRGPNITKGYFQQPEKTAEVFLPDGWFATGDIGEWNPDGTLRIVGRVKALAKNSYGEYIALEALESVYTTNSLILPNGICILVHPLKPFIVALVLTDEEKVRPFMERHQIEGTYPDVLESEVFLRKALESLQETAMSAGRHPFEIVKKVWFGGAPKDEWTVENGILTAAMKIKRREIDRAYEGIIDGLFQEK
ncbi:fatty acyl CoA synthetase [Perkinsela sp. CCAP 1560/4]|nr:fatty acyl CoA synthetase [Perkinsela sp. CCAP 1560/4]|eukprot:KNH05088.1 fatty acyl CoA synthetase [Perkinsela sp. CCAP 1560/4]